MDFQPNIDEFSFGVLSEMKYPSSLVDCVSLETDDKFTIYTKGHLSIYVFDDGKIFISEEINDEWRLISNSNFKTSNSTKDKTLVVSFD
ncbi:hypothetical protein NHG29_01630 [Aerococcaceae bacterium NML160702]|nr:hypothetical protein [Aerococcaceae bacterium NML160702]